MFETFTQSGGLKPNSIVKDDGKEKVVTTDNMAIELLGEILLELKKINTHLYAMTDEEII